MLASARVLELELRLAHTHEMLRTVETDEDGQPVIDLEQLGALFSALDYALRGSPGCVEREEWYAERAEALAKHGTYLGLG